MDNKNEYYIGKKCYLCETEPDYCVILAPEEVLACEEHYSVLYARFIEKKKKQSACNLSQLVLHDKQGTKLTAGKSWEIQHRGVSKDDNSTVINMATGKEAQY